MSETLFLVLLILAGALLGIHVGKLPGRVVTALTVAVLLVAAILVFRGRVG